MKKHPVSIFLGLLTLLLIWFAGPLNQRYQSTQLSSRDYRPEAGIPSSPSVRKSATKAKVRARHQHEHIPQISREQAIVRAVNQRSPLRNGEGYQLDHPLHTATFTRDGLRFQPRGSRMDWHWKLRHFGTDENDLMDSEEKHEVPADSKTDGIIRYDHGAFVERYLEKVASIEQQFLIQEKVSALKGRDLVIRGDIKSAGTFESRSNRGWVWRDQASQKVVSLGQVHVYDAEGTTIPARMEATQGGTEIRVEGAALLAAHYPVTVDPEIGTNDLFLGGATLVDLNSNNIQPSVAYNEGLDEFLVVWGRRVGGDIMGQRVSAATGKPIGFRFQINRPYSGYFIASHPQVACSGTGYLVVWSDREGDRTTIFGRALGTIGQLLGEDAVLIESSRSGDSSHPCIAADPEEGNYLVVWQHEHPANHELFGRFVSAEGIPEGENDFPFENSAKDPREPSLAFDRFRDQYCVAWSSIKEREVYAQLVWRTGAVEDPVRVSMPIEDPLEPSIGGAKVIFNRHQREYLMVWYRAHSIDGQRVEKVYGRRMTDRLSRYSPDEMLISNDRNAQRHFAPTAIYDEMDGAYLLAWRAWDDGKGKILGAVIDSASGEIIDGDVVWHEGRTARLVTLGYASRPGTDTTLCLWDDPYIDGPTLSSGVLGKPMRYDSGEWTNLTESLLVFGAAHHEAFRSFRPDVAYSPVEDRYMVVWEQEAVAKDSWHIFARQLSGTGKAYEEKRVSQYRQGSGQTLINNRHPKVRAAEDGRFLVVWQGDWKLSRFHPLETEIFGRFMDSRGRTVDNPIRISYAGRSGDANAGAETPAIAYNNQDQQFLVVWRANAPSLANGNGVWELYGLRLRASDGHRLGIEAPLTTTSTEDVPATSPAVAYNAAENNYFLVWQGTDGRVVSMAPNEREIIGRPLDRSGRRTNVPANRISDMGAPRNRAFGASQPDIAYNSRENQFLVVWTGNDGIINDFEIHGQFLNHLGRDIGGNFQISDMGLRNHLAHFFPARHPAVSYQEAKNEYVVVWAGTDVLPGMIAGEEEVFGRYVTSTGLDDSEAFRISDLGPDGNNRFDAAHPSLTSNGAGDYLVTFTGNDDRGPLSEERSAVFGQELDSARPLEFLRIAAVRAFDDTIEIDIEATDGTQAQVQASEDLEQWRFMANVEVIGGATTYRHQNIIADKRAHFYRVVVR